jgi:hypothetical protein
MNLLYPIAEEHDTPKQAQYWELLLWAQASSHGPECSALSHQITLLLHGLYVLNPSCVHLAMPKSAQLRRARPDGRRSTEGSYRKASRLNWRSLSHDRRYFYSGCLFGNALGDAAQRAITEALPEGQLDRVEAKKPRKIVQNSEYSP